jgi:hypothetical protein
MNRAETSPTLHNAAIYQRVQSDCKKAAQVYSNSCVIDLAKRKN